MLRMISADSLAAALRRAGLADVRSDGTTRAAYSSDASLYRVRPLVVALPRSADEVAAALAVCRGEGVPVTSRGGGTSVAGNAVGPGLVLDFSRHMNRVLAVDAENRTATVEPGAVQIAVQQAAAKQGLRFGPDPSTYTRCTVGGMIGNNACGARTLGYGRTSDNVTAVRVLTGTGESLHLNGDRSCVADAGAPAAADHRQPRDDPHRIRPVRPSGVGLRAGAPVAGEQVRRHPHARRQRRYARDLHRGHGAAGDRPAAPGAGRPGLPRHRGRG